MLKEQMEEECERCGTRLVDHYGYGDTWIPCNKTRDIRISRDSYRNGWNDAVIKIEKLTGTRWSKLK